MAHTPAHPASLHHRWTGLRIGITGIRGTLGQALCRQFLERGAVVVGLSHGSRPLENNPTSSPQEWAQWSCDQERELDPVLATLDVLIVNHGINPGGDQSSDTLTRAITINALSSWNLIKRFEAIAATSGPAGRPRELWVNTSEAEIQPALSPAYELSKRLIGQLVSLRWSNRSPQERERLRLRKLVLGPFKSELNPIGILSAEWVARQVLNQAQLNLALIIVTPNPMTYVLMPLCELGRAAYNRVFNRPCQ
ncbi:MAG: SDR family oxidoreductase [Synechococcus sp.]|nr:SDR family oxidoreductase [Synechococcus sp.]